MKTYPIIKAPILKATVIAGMALALAGPLPAAAADTAPETQIEAQIEAMQNELIRMKNKLRVLEARTARPEPPRPRPPRLK